MQWTRHTRPSSALIALLLPYCVSSNTLDCSHARDDGTSWDLSKLGGPKAVVWARTEPPVRIETTFTLDICNKLPRNGPKGEDCPSGSRVCATENIINKVEGRNETGHVIPIAGNFVTSTGGTLESKWTRLKTSSRAADHGREGVELQMGGGKYPPGKNAKKQKAIIEFLCDARSEERRNKLSQREDDGEEDDPEEGDEEEEKGSTDDGEGGKLTFQSYAQVGDEMLLNLEWHTKFACENAQTDAGSSSSGHWGFFTWLIVIIFLGVATYLIFGSWINYSRYSARGWDLVPHSETIRDLPYLFKDWMRRVVSTIQGGGSRGGYSAV